MPIKLTAVENICIGGHRLQRIEYFSSDGRTDWALVRPPLEGSDWVVCLHGHGSRGDQLYTRADIRDAWLPVFIELGLGILTPNLRENAWMGPRAVPDMSGLIDILRERWGANRFMFASGSMGGTGNLIYAGLHPENVNAVVALGAASDLAAYYNWCRSKNEGVIKEIADAIEAAYDGPPGAANELYARHSVIKNAGNLDMPVYIAHGSRDALIPVGEMRRLCGALAEKPDFVYREIPDGNHDSPLWCTDAFSWAAEKMRQGK